MINKMNGIISDIQNILEDFNISLYGFTPLEKPISIGFYKKWVDKNHHGSMDFLKTNLDLKSTKNPLILKKGNKQFLINPEDLKKEQSIKTNKFKTNKLLNNVNTNHITYSNPSDVTNELGTFLKPAKSAIVIGIFYAPKHPAPLANENNKLSHLTTALYSRGEDYHIWFKKLLNQIADQMSKKFPQDLFISWTDSVPLIERDLAFRAGLGWYGKNTCLINKSKGSLFLIGEILTTLALENSNPLSANYCGSCNKCIEACPTGALQNNYTLESSKCISYLTIESKAIPELNLRPLMGDWLFGCDICQTVCPWNQPTLKQMLHNNLQMENEKDIGTRFQSKLPLSSLNNNNNNNNNTFTELQKLKELEWILESSSKELQKALTNTAYSRSAGVKLKRNALIVIGNSKLKSLKPSVEKYLQHKELSDLAQWALDQFLNK